MKTLLKLIIAFFAMLYLSLALTSCASRNPYWSYAHHSGIERYHKLKKGWPVDHCNTYNTTRPIKRDTYRKYFFYRNPHARR